MFPSFLPVLVFLHENFEKSSGEQMYLMLLTNVSSFRQQETDLISAT